MSIFLHPCFNMEPTSVFGASYSPGCSPILLSPGLAYLKKGSKLQTNQKQGNRAPHPSKKNPNKNTTKKKPQKNPQRNKQKTPKIPNPYESLLTKY